MSKGEEVLSVSESDVPESSEPQATTTTPKELTDIEKDGITNMLFIGNDDNVKMKNVLAKTERREVNMLSSIEIKILNVLALFMMFSRLQSLVSSKVSSNHSW